jgi:DNA-binding transcriptional MerR regulator
MIQVGSRRIYTINDVAKHVGVHSHAIALAEKEGRIAAARRDEAGARWYDEYDLERLRTIFVRGA